MTLPLDPIGYGFLLRLREADESYHVSYRAADTLDDVPAVLMEELYERGDEYDSLVDEFISHILQMFPGAPELSELRICWNVNLRLQEENRSYGKLYDIIRDVIDVYFEAHFTLY